MATQKIEQGAPVHAPPGMRRFILLWLGQSVSLLGSGLTGFALGVWVYRRTGSLTQFALINLSTSLPGIVFAPFAGALVDRWDRRRVMIASDSASALCTLVLLLMIAADRIAIWHIYLVLAISSTFSAFQMPAYSASTTLLVPKQHFARASGMVQVAQAASHVVSPALGAVLLVSLGIGGVFMIDFVTLLVALATLVLVKIPRPPASQEGREAVGSLAQEAAFGWKYIRMRPGLFGLLLMLTWSNYVGGVVTSLLPPFILGFAPETALGGVLSIGGVGMLVGGLIMTVWGGPRRRIYGMFVGILIEGLALCMVLAGESIPLIALAAFLFMGTIPLVNACSQAIWQSKVAPDVQGRVFSVRRMIAWCMLPVAHLTAPPLAERVFEPLMAVGGGLAGSVGRVIGTGQGRGIALLITLLALVNFAVIALSYAHPRVRHVEDELPDAV